MEKTKVIPLLVRFTAEQIAEIEVLWHLYKFPSRSAMVRRLVDVGIARMSNRKVTGADGK